jgi:RHS repeat-associated protein
VETYQNDLLATLTKGSGTPQQATWTYGYTAAGQRTAVTDPNGHLATATYDSAGNLLTSTDGLNHTTRYTYSPLNDLLTVTDPLGRTMTVTRDPVGHPLSVWKVHTEDGQVVRTTFTYGDPSHPGDVTAVTDPDGKTTALAYDAAGNRIRSTDPIGNVTTFGYNAIGWRTSRTSPLGNATGGNPAQHTWVTTYDAVGDVLTITDPLGDLTTYVYDADHNLFTQTDATTHLTKYVHDLGDQLTEVDRPDGSVVKTSYDGNGQMATQTDGLGHTTANQYDPLRRLAKTTDPLNRSTLYGYDGAGNQTSVTDPLSRQATMGYDAANRLTGTTYSDGVTPNVSYGYDADNHRTSMTDGTGTTTYTYDSVGRLVHTTDTPLLGTVFDIGYTYDLRGSIVTLNYPGPTLNGTAVNSNTTVSRAYYDNGQMKSVTDWLGKTTQFGYDPDGNMVGETFPNGVSTALSYDLADQLARSTTTGPAGTILDLPYTRDAIGQLTSANALGTSPGVTQTYSYDPTNRLLDAAVPAGSTSVPGSTYTYDHGDHLTSITRGGQLTSTLRYDNADELISNTTSAGQTTYGHDQAGNRLTRTDPLSGLSLTTYGYDQANRLTSYAGPAMNAAGPSTIQVNYSYNGDGLRMGKGAAGVVPTLYGWDVAEGLPLLLQDTATSYVTDPSGLPLEQMQANGTVLYYHHDQLGSTRALTDKNGLVVATYAYDPYGNSVGTLPAVVNPFQYAGQYQDVETGLYYMRARYYEPTTGSFLSRDPMVATTRSPYGYVAGNPVNAKDPSGLDPWWQDLAPQDRGPDFTVNTVSYGFYSISTITTHPADPSQSQTFIDQHMGLSLVPASYSHFDGWIGGKSGPTPCADEINSFVNAVSAEYMVAAFNKGGAVVWGNVGSFGKRDFAVLQGFSTPQVSLSLGLAAPFFMSAGACGDFNPSTGQSGTYSGDGSFTAC